MALNSNLPIKSLCNTVVLVEDNKAEADLTRIIYRELSLPVEIVHFQNGEEFITFLSENGHDGICYVLLDLNMPRLNGFEILVTLARNDKWKHLAVIIFSSSSNEKDIAKCYELGANAYVAKPLDLNELDRSILSIHGFWGGVNIKPMPAITPV